MSDVQAREKLVSSTGVEADKDGNAASVTTGSGPLDTWTRHGVRALW